MLYFLMCLYISIYYVRPTDWIPGLIGVPIFFVLGIFCIILLLLASLSNENNLLKRDLELVMAGFIVAIIFSHLSHGYIGGAKDSLIDFIPNAIGFFLVLKTLDSRNKINQFVLLLIILTTFIAFEGCLQHITGFSHGGMSPYFEGIVNTDGTKLGVERIRWYGVFNDPNDLGMVLVLVLPFLINKALSRSYLLSLICFPIIASAIYFTNSRGSMLAALAAVLSFFVIRYRSVKGVVIGFVMAFVLFTFGPNRMVVVSANEASAYGRLESWYQGYQMFKTYPFFGVGQGAFTDHHYLTAHNTYVLVLAELGIVGTFFFTGLIYYPFNWAWRNIYGVDGKSLSESDVGLLSAVFSSFVGLLVALFFLSRAYMLVPYMVMALAMASARICTPDDSNEESPASDNQYHVRNIALLSILQIVFINAMIKLFL